MTEPFPSFNSDPKTKKLLLKENISLGEKQKIVMHFSM